jgi:DsbC/DsbD-like thiol-disulfide interchange protein
MSIRSFLLAPSLPTFALAIALSALLALSCPARPHAAEPSAWSDAHGGAVRLVPGEQTAPGSFRAGLEFRLAEGWKTYWRNPGDAGVPPTFDWSRSDNVAKVTLSWPGPQRFDDEGGTSIGYKGDVILPIEVDAKDRAKPATLSLALDYAVCETICVPAKGEATLVLDPSDPGSPREAERIRIAQGRVPVPSPLGAPGKVGIDEVMVDRSETPPRLVVVARAPPGAGLFVEGPDNWYLPVPTPEAGQRRDGLVQFVLPLEGTPKGAVLAGTPLRFTLVSSDGSVETLYNIP